MKKKIGFIGFGTIGSYIYKHLAEEGNVELAFVYANRSVDDPAIAPYYTESAEEVYNRCAQGVDLVIEAATSSVIKAMGLNILQYTNLLLFSITAFADDSFHKGVKEVCAKYQHTCIVPHGAILGLDGIFDGRSILQSVNITTTKKPANLGLSNTERQVMYDGPTRGACAAFPRNVNVHAAIALAGLGFEKTHSMIVSDPNAKGNTHHIEIVANGCNFNIDVLSTPVSGVTGAYTPVSAFSSVKRALFKQGLVID